ncbi:hypothetical protein [Amycolatopsis sp. lyj-346]|uniref:hypothetical protein n=1 Tax=Amycolatopsis sp. lyj-346 TaxID=2789289 RepID=UPI003978B4E9
MRRTTRCSSSLSPAAAAGFDVGAGTARWNLNGVNPVFVKAIVRASGSSGFVRIDDMTTQCHW